MFDWDNVKDETVFEPLPRGEYEVQISETSYGPNSAGTGDNFVVTYQVAGGQHDGRTLKRWFALRNPSKQAEEIAMQGVKQLLDACGLDLAQIQEPHHLRQLEGQRCIILVDQETRKDTGALTNRVKSAKPLAGTQATPKVNSAPQQSTGSQASPW